MGVGQCLDLCLSTKLPRPFGHCPVKVKAISFGIRQTWVRILPLPPARCMTQGKFLNLLQFCPPPLYTVANNRTDLKGL